MAKMTTNKWNETADFSYLNINTSYYALFIKWLWLITFTIDHLKIIISNHSLVVLISPSWHTTLKPHVRLSISIGLWIFIFFFFSLREKNQNKYANFYIIATVIFELCSTIRSIDSTISTYNNTQSNTNIDTQFQICFVCTESSSSSFICRP